MKIELNVRASSKIQHGTIELKDINEFDVELVLRKCLDAYLHTITAETYDYFGFKNDEVWGYVKSFHGSDPRHQINLNSEQLKSVESYQSLIKNHETN